MQFGTLENTFKCRICMNFILQRDTSLANQYQVHPPSTYHYLNQSGCTKLDGVDDAAKVRKSISTFPYIFKNQCNNKKTFNMILI